jgi:hypothetical protein
VTRQQMVVSSAIQRALSTTRANHHRRHHALICAAFVGRQRWRTLTKALGSDSAWIESFLMARTPTAV